MSSRYDVVVVGSGITGVAAAAAAAERGARVLVIDKEDGPAREASGRAQGSLRVQGRHPAELPLAVEAMRLWREAAADDPQHDAELVMGGNLYLATAPDERPMLRALVDQARSSGLDAVAYLDPHEVRELVPAASGPLLGGMWSPYDAQAQPALATELFVRRAQRAGVGFSFGTTATELLTAGGRITGLRTSRGALRPREIVVAAGAWSSHLLASAGVALPVMPVILSELETGPVAPLFSPSVRAFGFGARQRPDGRLVVSAGLGAVVTRYASLYDVHGLRWWLPRAAAYRKNLRLRLDAAQLRRELRLRRSLDASLVPATSPEPPCDRASVDLALERLAEVFPSARAAVARRHWGGLVDMTPDGLPVIDRCGPDGLTVVAGLCGHGLALGPVLGRVAAELALDATSSRPLDAFRLSRFDGSVPAPELMI